MFSFVLFLIYLVLVSLLFFSNHKWWIKINSQNPKCTYYFGPFDSRQEAQERHQEYLQDIEAEGATDIEWVIEKCHPHQLTIAEDEPS